MQEFDSRGGGVMTGAPRVGEVSCALQRGIGLMCARSNQNIARASGRQFMPGCDVPV